MISDNIVEIFTFATRTPGNSRRHWTLDAGEAKKQRTTVCNRLKGNRLPAFPPKLVTITRVGARKLDKWNLPGALKHVIDGVADAFGVDDRDERWEMKFEQDKSSAGVCGVIIVIEPREAS